MAGIEIKMPTRPCWVNGRKGMFHQWIEKEDTILTYKGFIRPDVMKKLRKQYIDTEIPPSGCEIEKVKNTYAIIEFEDGKVKLMPPTTITFLDSNFDVYDWRREELGETCNTCKFCNELVVNYPCSQCVHNSDTISNGVNRWEKAGD